jgi:hypothetical protein
MSDRCYLLAAYASCDGQIRNLIQCTLSAQPARRLARKTPDCYCCRGSSSAPKPQIVQDPVKVDPKHYNVEVENEQVRVLRVNYKKHEKSMMHSHPDNVAIFLSDAHCRFTFPDGKTGERRFRAGESLYSPAGSHLPENLSGHAIDIILVELKW